jgi:hypothetical protein
VARHAYPTRYTSGPFQLIRHRMQTGYAIIDTRTKRYAYTEPHPNTGRPVPTHLPLGKAMDRMQRLAVEANAR